MLKEFDKIIGYNDIKAELERICDILINPEKYKKLGVNLPNGLMFYGGPGVGKTTMAFCFAEATKRKVFVCRKDMPEDDFVREIKKTFDKAVENAPSIVFLDDLDRYSNEDPLHQNTIEMVSVQACIDGCKGKDVFVIATANNMDAIPGMLKLQMRIICRAKKLFIR